MISVAQIQDRIAKGMSIQKMSMSLHISKQTLRAFAAAHGIELPQPGPQACRNGHQKSARRLIGGRERCGACYDEATRRADADRRAKTVRTRDWVSGPRKGAVQTRERSLSPSQVDNLLAEAVRNESLPRWQRQEGRA